jgi:predicted nucleic acid-binding protein
MFESEKHLVYFQNFSKVGTSDLWYRLSKDPLNILRNTQKIALVCFTNPSENIVFEIPINDIDKRAAETKWIKDFFEVNIDPANSIWRELDWQIEKYLVNFKA